MVSMAVTGLTGQTWSAFVVSELMTGRVKSSKVGLWAVTRPLEPTGSSDKVSGVVTGLLGQITGSWIETGHIDGSKSDSLTEIR